MGFVDAKTSARQGERTAPSGTRAELIWMRPCDHIGWTFEGPGHFARLAEPFLREGSVLGERGLLVVDDPDDAVYRRLAQRFAPGEFEIASIADVYGEPGIVDAGRQLGTFSAALRQAESVGYAGIRLAVDHSAHVEGHLRTQAWTNGELVAQDFLSENNITRLCGFDRRRVNVDALRHLATLHPLSSVNDPLPQFRLFLDAEGLYLEGQVDELAIEMLKRALDAVPRSTPRVLDLAHANVRGSRARSALEGLAGHGIKLALPLPLA